MTATPLSARTTLRVGGVPAAEIVIDSIAECGAAVAEASAARRPWVVVGGGSNMVAADGPLDLTVLIMRAAGVDVQRTADGDAVLVTADAGMVWDDFVALAIEQGWSGVEALSGIPGTVGATPIQNVGAYGSQVSDVITEVEVLDSRDSQRRWVAADGCGFGYRSSMFKRAASASIITRVRFRLAATAASGALAHPQLAAALDASPGAIVDAAQVRSAVLHIRRAKGMVLDDADQDTWSAGSYFTNPVVDGGSAGHLPSAMPRWAEPDGRIKVSAAWLIESCGFSRGFSLPGSSIAISGKHTLALTNRGNGTAAQVRELEAEIQRGVRDAFGVSLEREPVLVGY